MIKTNFQLIKILAFTQNQYIERIEQISTHQENPLFSTIFKAITPSEIASYLIEPNINTTAKISL